MGFAVLLFPGSSGMECVHAVETLLQQPVHQVWHKEQDLSNYDAIILPGGFSYGDYLRPGALAALSPVIDGIRAAAEQGTLILGIGNGFQILLEAGLLPGTIRPNDHQQFRCGIQDVRVEQRETPFTREYQAGEVIQLPFAHGQGNYYCDPGTLRSLEEAGQIVFRYSGENPNGSVDGIAGLVNKEGNILGTMLRPERVIAQGADLGGDPRLFTSMFHYRREQKGAI